MKNKKLLHNVIFKPESFGRDRKNEIQYLTEQLLQHNKLLIVGEKGVGKTEVVKSVSNYSIKKIDLMKFSTKNFNNYSFYHHLGLSSVGCLEFLHVWIHLILIFFLPYLGLSSAIVLEPIIMNFSKNWYLLFIMFGPVLLLILLLMIWLLQKYVIKKLKILSFLKYIPIVKKWKWVKKINNKIILITELNFIDNSQKDNLYFLFTNLFKIFSHHKIIIESSELNEEFIDKFGMMPIDIFTNRSNFQLVKNTFDELDILVEKSENEGFKSAHKINFNIYEQMTEELSKIVKYFTYRELGHLMIKFYNLYDFHTGTLNIFDYLLHYLLTKKYNHIFLKLPFKKMIEYNNFNDINKDKKIWIYGTRIERYLVEILSPNDVNDEILSLIGESRWFPDNGKQPLSFGYNNGYKNNYQGSIGDRKSDSYILSKFLSNPLNFILDFSNEEKLNYRMISDENAKNVIESINNGDLNELLNSDYKINKYVNAVELVLNNIWNTRKSKSEFIQLLSPEIRYIFLSSISNDNQFMYNPENMIYNKYINQQLSEYSKIKNYRLQNYTLHNEFEYIDVNEYLAWLNKNKMVLQTKFNYLYRTDIRNKSVFHFIIFLGKDQTISQENKEFLESLKMPVIIKQNGLYTSLNNENEMADLIIKVLYGYGY